MTTTATCGAVAILRIRRSFYGVVVEPTNDCFVCCLSLGDDGRVTKRNLFPVPRGACVVAAFKSQVFVQLEDKLHSYDESTGARTRSLKVSAIGLITPFQSVVSKSRNELFLADGDSNISAFCLDEPRFV